jgi:hypothetical protein
MAGTNPSVEGTERDTAGRTVGDEQAIEGVTGPIKPQSMANDRHQRDVVNRESRVLHDRSHELGAAYGEPPDLGQELDLEEGNRRHAPGSIAIDPGKLREPLRSEDEPDQEVRIEE